MNIFQSMDEMIAELELIEAKLNSKVEIALNRLRKVRVILNQAADEEAAALRKISIGVPDPAATEEPDDAPDEADEADETGTFTGEDVVPGDNDNLGGAWPSRDK